MGSLIKVAVAGAYGKMGREVMKGVLKADDMLLVGATDIVGHGLDVGSVVGLELQGITITGNLEEIFRANEVDVLIDFTNVKAVMRNSILAIDYGVSPIVGTTGLTQAELEQLHSLCEQKQIGAIVAPNFALGAILLMQFAKEAAKHFPDIEIIELHHDGKMDAPSGTAISTAQAILEERGNRKQGHPNEFEKISGARGAQLHGIPIHSVRLPGFIAHEEVIFGGLGQTLTIRHDSTSRESFIPGVLFAARQVKKLKKAVFGLDKII
ncbi:4-hydroxy-tetrahydrodipicolinate reductase [Bacillota bacterium LX-D]|nr:4-hydroxy-tetrahydrodipicolinate reductase [Bacillota bacterium LX-D]